MKPLRVTLDSLKQWLEGNKLSLNVIKTQAMVLGSRPNIKKISDKSVPTPSFAIGGSHIRDRGAGGAGGALAPQ